MVVLSEVLVTKQDKKRYEKERRNMDKEQDQKERELCQAVADAFLSIFGQNEVKEFGTYMNASWFKTCLERKQLSMRNARLMNDYKEIRYGKELFSAFFDSKNGEKFWEQIEPFTSFSTKEDFKGQVLQKEQTFDDKVYILCFTEHDENDKWGRLSMWRGYGQSGAIEWIVKKNFFPDIKNQQNLFFLPVLYFDKSKEEFGKKMVEYGRQISEKMHNISHTSNAQLDEALKRNFGTLLILWFTVMLFILKHPGFEEEREWRLIALQDSTIASKYEGKRNENTNLQWDIADVKGLLQRVLLVPLDVPGKEEPGRFSINNCLEKIIIGPNENQWELEKSLLEVLRGYGIQENKLSGVIVKSDIPYREK